MSPFRHPTSSGRMRPVWTSISTAIPPMLCMHTTNGQARPRGWTESGCLLVLICSRSVRSARSVQAGQAAGIFRGAEVLGCLRGAEVAGIFRVAEAVGIFRVAEVVGIFRGAEELPPRVL